MRARAPDHTGTVDRDGVPIAFEVHGSGEPTVVLVPPSPITYSRIWKAQLPWLARRNRVVTIDGRGSGRSGRPTAVTDHTRAANVADVRAVLDATGVERTILVAHCHASWWALDVATAERGRVDALVALSPGVPYLGPSQPHWRDAAAHWDDVPVAVPTGWALCTRHAITHHHRRWVEFFFREQLVEPHSSRAYEEAVAWALESTGGILAAAEEAADLDPPGRAAFEAQCRELGIPTLVVHGDRDVCQHVERGRAFAEATGGAFVRLAGSGHLALVRDPVAVARPLAAFLDRVTGRTGRGRAGTGATAASVEEGRRDGRGGATMRSTIWSRGLDRPRRVLYVSSPIGLGHARRDLAIAQQLRALRPEVEVDWLAQHPVTTVLEGAGESVHPASRWLASESAHIASEASGHDLHCFQALRRMDEILVANFMVFQEVVEEGLYDLVIADEAWDIDHHWHENPELKRGAHVWLTDFVGYLPMPSGGAREAELTADYNAEMIEHIARYPRIRDRALFVGNPDDVVPDTFGPGLPKIREWTEAHFDFTGYITGFTPPQPDEAAAWRRELGWEPDERVVVVSVGGSGVGRAMLERTIAAFPHARRAIDDLRMVVVAGPRIDPDTLPTQPGLEIHGYVDRLYRHLAVCDLAVVQGGLTTTMELTAAQRPFVYVPLGDHFEQNHHVRFRLDNHGAGRCMTFAETEPEALAAAMVDEIGRDVAYRPVGTDGARRAATAIADLI